LVSTADGPVDLVETPAASEHDLQEIVKANPRLIPTEDLGLEGELLVIGRETVLASGAVDLLCLARSGDVVIVEFKTGPQNPDFRAALAQLVDYGSDLWKLSLDEFEAIAQRYFAGPRATGEARGARDLEDAVARMDWSFDDEERAAFTSRLAEVLATGDFHFVVAAQRFTDPMRSTLDYLNHTMQAGRFFLVEVILLSNDRMSAHAAQVVAAPPRRGVSGASSPSVRVSEAELLANLPDESFRAAVGEVLAACAGLGLSITGRSKGLSIRIQTPAGDRLTIAWVLPPGEQWYRVRDFALGFDPGSRKVTDAIRPRLERFAARAEAINGSAPVPSSVNVHTFAPSVLPGVVQDVIAALESLVSDV
jgi:hypothetical protein